MAVKNMEASVLARLKQQAKDNGMSYQVVLQLMEKLSTSENSRG